MSISPANPNWDYLAANYDVNLEIVYRGKMFSLAARWFNNKPA